LKFDFICAILRVAIFKISRRPCLLKSEIFTPLKILKF
jgi:hypothetical protein